MKRAVPLVFVLALWVSLPAAQTKSAKTLDIYVVGRRRGKRGALCAAVGSVRSD